MQPRKKERWSPTGIGQDVDMITRVAEAELGNDTDEGSQIANRTDEEDVLDWGTLALQD